MLAGAGIATLAEMSDSGRVSKGRTERHNADAERAVIDRLDKLRLVLPALAQDAAEARREASKLRVENDRLIRHVAALQAECARLLELGGPDMPAPVTRVAPSVPRHPHETRENSI